MSPTRVALRSLVAFSLACFACSGLAQSAPRAGKHPPLVAAAGAKCATCHAEVLKGRTTHPGVEDCSQCHEVSGAGAETTVRFTTAPPELCLGCHSDLADAAAGKLASSHAPVADGCANCHRPHASDEPHLMKAPARELCLSCHEAEAVAKSHPVPLGRSECGSCHAAHGSASKGMLAGRFVHAPFGDRSCGACHQKGRAVRSRKGSRSSQAATCFACHSDLEEKFARGVVHAPVKEGRCSSCHDPHVSQEPKLAKAKGALLCAGCHGEIAALASGKGGHAPARDGCVACHDPHRSDLPKLLARSGPALCGRCHDPKGKDLRKKHLGADMAKLDCATCHDAHGSAAGSLFLAGSVHAPFAERSCDSCHEGGSFAKLAGGGGKGLCTACHGDVEQAAEKVKVRHAALDGDCTTCHSPHDSARAKLVRGTDGEACGSCHAEQAAGAGEVAHGVISSLGCEACHEPHGGSNPRLLRVAGDALCLGCHDGAKLKPSAGESAVRLLGRFEITPKAASAIRTVTVGASGPVNHPVAGHRSSGPAPAKASPRLSSTFQGEMTCLTCHDPHKGKSSRLLVKGGVSATDACLRCHPK